MTHTAIIAVSYTGTVIVLAAILFYIFDIRKYGWPMKQKTAFNQFVDKEMESKSFRAAYKKAVAELEKETRSKRIRGWGPFRKEWGSICSRHMYGSPGQGCELCDCGQWRNSWLSFLSGLVYKISPSLWRFWKNKSWRK